MATKISTIYTLITADDGPLKRGLASARTASITGASKIQTALNKINFRAVGLAAVAFGGTVAYGLKKAVDAASALEEATGKFNVVFRDQLGQAGLWAKELVASYGLSSREAKQYLSSIQDLLKPMGVASDVAAKLSNEVVKLAVDLGSFNDQETPDVMRDIQSALVGNFETMKKYGVVLNETVVKQEALRQGIIKGKEALTAAQKATIAYDLMIRGSADAMGDRARTAKGYANTMKQLGATIEEISAKIGDPLMPALADVARGFSDWASENNKLLQQDIPSYTRQVGEALLTVVDSFSKLAAVFDKLPSGSTVATAGGIIGYKLFGKSGPAGLIAALTVLSAIDIYKNFDAYNKALSESAMPGPMGTTFGQFAEGYKDTVEQINKLLRQLGILDEYSMKVGTGMRNALSWKQKGDSGGTGITTGGGFDGGKPKPLPGPPKPSYPGANAFEMNRFRQAAILQRDADKANEILLESNKRVVPVLTDMWATYNTEEVQAATRMAEEKAETLRLWEEENKKTSSRMLQLSERTAWAMQESFSDVFYDQMKGKLETFKDYFSTFLDTMQRAWADIMGQMMTQWIFGQDMKGGGMLSQAWSFVSGILGGLGGDGGGGGATSLSTARWSPRAAGGPVSMGSPYLVGEKGPELFVPNKSGNIIPDKQVSGGGNVYHLYNITANDAASFVELARRSGAVPLLAAENLADNGSLRKAIAESL